MQQLRIAFAGDRDIGVWVLDFLLAQGVRPLALLVPDQARASQAATLKSRCRYLPEENISVGPGFQSPDFIAKLRDLKLDYIFGIHFPYLVPESVLAVSGNGFLNLHPAYLPFNRGWHAPTWSILDGTPSGATLHFMDKGLDTGDIIHRKELQVVESDTADALYQKLKKIEFDVFKEAWPQLLSGKITRIPQDPAAGSFRKRRDLYQPEIQKINLDEETTARNLLARLRALTTDRLNEAAYFDVNGVRQRVQITISPENAADLYDSPPVTQVEATASIRPSSSANDD